MLVCLLFGSLRGALLEQDILQPDHCGSTRLEDVRRDEEHGTTEVLSESTRVPPTQSDT